jgi:cytochrome c-type biogenesis protein CcmH/NrfG
VPAGDRHRPGAASTEPGTAASPSAIDPASVARGRPVRARLPRRRVALLHGAAIAGVTLLAYAGSFTGEFVSDDLAGVRDNPLLRSLAWSNVKRIFASFDDSNYIPLKVLSLALDYRLWGPEPWGFHATNLALHVGCALWIYAILLRLELAAGTACLVALLWAVHPLQVESVAWVSERKNVLSGLFFFATFHAYLVYTGGRDAGRRTAAYLGALALYVLALLSKMNTMVLPALFLAYEATWRFRVRAAHVLACLPFLAAGTAVAYYNLAENRVHGAAWHGGSVIVTWLTSAGVVFGYLRRVILPVGLRPWYEIRLRDSLADPVVVLALLGLVAIAAATIRLVRRRRREAFWILWFFIALAPMLNVVVPFRVLMQDRYMYLALLGPLVLVVTGLAGAARHGAAARAGVMTAAAAAVVACAVLTHRQVEVWASPFALWQRGTEGQAWIAADPVYKGDEYDRQVAYLEDAARRDPSSAALRNNLGGFYFAAGRIDAARVELEAAAALAPDDPVVLTNLGRVHAHAGRLAEAADLLERALARDRYSAVARFALVQVHIDRGDAAAARRELTIYARLFPDRQRSPMVARERARLARLEGGR